MNFLKFLGDLLVFILSLGVLIIVHEAGHLTMAKLFKVYCYEFSIGMGPAIYKRKPKKKGDKVGQGETIFSIRALPIGGYVAMAGEDDEKDLTEKPEIEIPHSRTIEGISHPRKALIMVAGVAVNFILGYILFFCNYAFCPQIMPESNEVNVAKESLVAGLGMETGDRITEVTQTFYIDGVETKLDKVTTESYYDISDALNYYEKVGNEVKLDYLPKALTDYRIVELSVAKKDGTVKNYSITTQAVINEAAEKDENQPRFTYDLLGITATTQMVGLGNAFVYAGKAWGNGCIAIFVALGQMFTPAGWSQMGGVVSMFKISSIATTNGLSVFFNLWGLISVNLAIFNLLPFPGLDGWQLLVTGIEGVTKKQLPKKFKTIASYVGLGLLMVLMVVLLFKDIFFPAI